MEQNNTSLKEFARRRSQYRLWQRIVSCLCAVSVFVTTYAMILPAITQEAHAYCGEEEHVHSVEAGCYIEERTLICTQEEGGEGHTHFSACYTEETLLRCGLAEGEGHTHSDDCYTDEEILICEDTAEDHTHGPECYETVRKITCGQEEAPAHTHGSDCYGTERVLTCGQAESESGHAHGDECYETTYTLTCEKEEHSHTRACYSDPTADLETAESWERSISGVTLTGDWARDVLAIAATQLGYRESQSNFTLNGAEEMGYTRYGAWYGVPYGDWCAMFISFCLHYADVEPELMPQDSSVTSWIGKLGELNLYHKTYNALNDREREDLLYSLRLELLAGHLGEEAVAPLRAELLDQETGVEEADASAVQFLSAGVELPAADTATKEELLALGEELLPALPAYMPQPGDLVFFDWDGDGAGDHVGMVYELLAENGNSIAESVSNARRLLADARTGQDEEAVAAAQAVLDAALALEPARVRTIEGNSADQVRYKVYDLTSASIMGYGALPENPDPQTPDTIVYTFTDLDSVLLSEVLESPAADFTLEDVEFVLAENADALQVERRGDDWALTPLEGFEDQEWLSVSLRGGGGTAIRMDNGLGVEISALECVVPAGEYLSGAKIPARLQFNLHSSSDILPGGYVQYMVPKQYASWNRYSPMADYSSNGHTLTTVTVDGVEYHVVQYHLKEIYGGNVNGMDAVIQTVDQTTPDGTVIPVMCRLLDESMNVLETRTSRIDHIKAYPNTFEKRAGSSWSGKDYDEDGYDDSVADGPWVTYNFNMKSLASSAGAGTQVGRRALESYTIVDTLPTYVDKNGVTRTAKFAGNGNDGWTLSADGKTVTYTGGKIEAPYFDRNAELATLTLKFPGAKTGDVVTNTFELNGKLVNQAANESDPHGSGSVPATLDNSGPPSGGGGTTPRPPFTQIDKSNSAAKIGSYRDPVWLGEVGTYGLYAALGGVRGDATADTKLTYLKMEDELIESDIYWTHLYFPNYANVQALNQVGTVYKLTIRLRDGSERIEYLNRVANSATIPLGEDVTAFALELVDGYIEVKGSDSSYNENKAEIYIRIGCKLRAQDGLFPGENIPGSVVYYPNTATFEMEYTYGSETVRNATTASATLRLELKKPLHIGFAKGLVSSNYDPELEKSYESFFKDDIATFTISLYADRKYGANARDGWSGLLESVEVKNLQILDLLPLGVEYVRMIGAVRIEPEVIANYNNTGRTALLWDFGDSVLNAYYMNPNTDRFMTYSEGSALINSENYGVVRVLEGNTPWTMNMLRYDVRITERATPSKGETKLNVNDAYMHWEGMGTDDVRLQYVTPRTPDTENIFGLGTDEAVLASSQAFKYIPPETLELTKRVKGDRDSEYLLTPAKGSAQRTSGLGDYQIQIFNRNKAQSYNEVTVLDILPRSVNDLQVSTVTEGNVSERRARGSDMDAYLNGQVTGPAGYTVWYTTADPNAAQYVEDMKAFTTANIWQNWSAVSANPAAVTAIKITMNSGTVLRPETGVSFNVPVKLPQQPEAVRIYYGDKEHAVPFGANFTLSSMLTALGVTDVDPAQVTAVECTEPDKLTATRTGGDWRLQLSRYIGHRHLILTLADGTERSFITEDFLQSAKAVNTFAVATEKVGYNYTESNFANLCLESYTVSGVAFKDLNLNGLYDEGGDLVYPRRSVRLINTATGAVVGETFTDSDGRYTLDYYSPGTYRVDIQIPDVMGRMDLLPYGNNILASQAETISGSMARTRPFTTDMNSPHTIRNAGYYDKFADLTVEKRVSGSTVDQTGRYNTAAPLASFKLRAEPRDDAPVVSDLGRNDSITILGLHDAWYLAGSGSAQGWIRRSAVTTAMTTDEFFRFTVRLEGSTQTPIPAGTGYVINNGAAVFYLANGGSLTLRDIPVIPGGKSYALVTEDAREGYTTSIAVSGHGTTSGNSRFISADVLRENPTVTVTNQNRELILKKVDASGNLITNNPAEFVIRRGDTGPYYTASGGWTDNLTDAGVRRFTTGADGQAELPALPRGVYALVETQTPAGYQVKDTQWISVFPSGNVYYGKSKWDLNQEMTATSSWSSSGPDTAWDWHSLHRSFRGGEIQTRMVDMQAGVAELIVSHLAFNGYNGAGFVIPMGDLLTANSLLSVDVYYSPDDVNATEMVTGSGIPLPGAAFEIKPNNWNEGQALYVAAYRDGVSGDQTSTITAVIRFSVNGEGVLELLRGSNPIHYFAGEIEHNDGPYADLLKIAQSQASAFDKLPDSGTSSIYRIGRVKDPNLEPYDASKGISVVNVSSGSLRLNKYAPDDSRLAGAVFTLTPGSGSSSGTPIVRTSSGSTYVEFSGLAPGDYSLVETSPPEGYVACNTVWAVTVADTGAVEIRHSSGAAEGDKVWTHTDSASRNEAAVLNVWNEEPMGHLELNKYAHRSYNRLAGVEFTLTNTATGATTTYTSLGDGPVLIDLKQGSYTLQETNAPLMVQPLNTVWGINVTNTGAVTISRQSGTGSGSWTWTSSNAAGHTTRARLNVWNGGKTATLQLNKFGPDGTTRVAGAEFELFHWGENDEEIYEYYTTSNTEPTEIALTPGTYYLYETYAPNGYEMGDVTSWQIVVAGGNGAITITDWRGDGPAAGANWSRTDSPDVNTPGVLNVINPETPRGTLRIQKTNGSGRGLSGAEFKLMHKGTGLWLAEGTPEWVNGQSNGKILTSGANGVLTVENLLPGSYILRETKAPDGHEISAEDYIVHVAGDGAVAVTGAEAYDQFDAGYYYYANRTGASSNVRRIKTTDGVNNHSGATVALSDEDLHDYFQSNVRRSTTAGRERVGIALAEWGRNKTDVSGFSNVGTYVSGTNGEFIRSTINDGLLRLVYVLNYGSAGSSNMSAFAVTLADNITLETGSADADVIVYHRNNATGDLALDNTSQDMFAKRNPPFTNGQTAGAYQATILGAGQVRKTWDEASHSLGVYVDSRPGNGPVVIEILARMTTVASKGNTWQELTDGNAVAAYESGLEISIPSPKLARRGLVSSSAPQLSTVTLSGNVHYVVENTPTEVPTYDLTVTKTLVGGDISRQTAQVLSDGAKLYNIPDGTGGTEVAAPALGETLILLGKYNDGAADWYMVQVSGGDPAWIRAQEVETTFQQFFTFEVTARSGSDDVLPAAIPGATVAGGKATFQLAHGGSLSIRDLPKDAVVTVTELETDGYRILYKEGANNLEGQKNVLTLTMNQDHGVEVVNNPGVELPQTGGPGTLYWTLGGLLLMGMAALMSVLPWRHGRERRLMR